MITTTLTQIEQYRVDIESLPDRSKSFVFCLVLLICVYALKLLERMAQGGFGESRGAMHTGIRRGRSPSVKRVNGGGGFERLDPHTGSPTGECRKMDWNSRLAEWRKRMGVEANDVHIIEVDDSPVLPQLVL